MTSQLIIGTKWLFGVPLTRCASACNEGVLAGGIGTRDVRTCNLIVPVTSVLVTNIYCTYHIYIFSILCGFLVRILEDFSVPNMCSG